MKKTLKSFISVLLAVMMLFSTAAPVFADDALPIESAQSVRIENSYTGSLTEETDMVFYKFTLAESGNVNIIIDASVEKYNVSLYNSDGEAMWHSDAIYWNSTTEKSQYTLDSNLVSGDYYFSVNKNNNCTGEYSFKITLKSAQESFAESTGVNNNTLENANKIDFGTKYTGQLAFNDDKDIYKFEIDKSGRVGFNMIANIYRVCYYIYDSKGNTIWESGRIEWDGRSEQSQSSYSFDLVAGTYYFCVSKGNSGTYTFNASFVSAGESFAESQSKTAGDIDSAFAIEFSTKYTGQIALNDDRDYYSFTLSESGEISINVTAVMANVYYHLIDKNGNLIWDSNRVCWDERSGQSQNTYSFDLVAGDYYFEVGKTHGSTGNYSFKIDYKSASESFKENQSTFYNDISTASAVKFDTLYKGQIASNDDKDMYSFSIAESGKVTLNINAYCYRLNYILYDENGDMIWSQDNIEWDANSKRSQRTYTLDLVAGKYYFGVLKNSTGNYDFKMTYKSANESFKENQTTKYNDIASASVISLGKEYNGQIAINDTNDYYKFTLAEPKKVYLKFSGAMNYLFYYVYDSNGNEVYSNGYHCNDVTGKFEATDSVDLSAGTYYLLCYELKDKSVEIWGSYTYLYGAKGTYTFCITDEAAKFDVTFDPKGGTVDPKTTTIKYEEEIELPTPSRSFTLSFNANGGKDAPEKKNVSVACLGWNTSDDGKAEYKCGDKFTTDENKTLFAVWAAETKYKLPSEIPTRDGYKFLGWAEDKNASAVQYNPGSEVTMKGDCTLFALWEKYETFTVNFNPDGGSVENGELTVKYGETVTLPEPKRVYTVSFDSVGGTGAADALKVSAVCLGWTASEDGNNVDYKCGETITVNKNISLRAVWKNDVQSVIPSSVPTKAGYKFLGWAKDKNASAVEYNPDSKITVNSDLTLFALWEEGETFVVNFNPDGGFVENGELSVKYGETVKIPEPQRVYTVLFDSVGGTGAPEALKVNAVCLGWTASEDGNNIDYKCGDTITVKENISLRAVWSNDVQAVLPSAIPSKTGYKFLGWSTDGSAVKTEYAAGANAYIISDMTLYAVWEKEIMRGDADGNGKVTASDARIALRISAKLQSGTESEITACDLDGNKKVTASEARMILRFSARLEKTL